MTNEQVEHSTSLTGLSVANEKKLRKDDNVRIAASAKSNESNGTRIISLILPSLVKERNLVTKTRRRSSLDVQTTPRSTHRRLLLLPLLITATLMCFHYAPSNDQTGPQRGGVDGAVDTLDNHIKKILVPRVSGTDGNVAVRNVSQSIPPFLLIMVLLWS